MTIVLVQRCGDCLLGMSDSRISIEVPVSEATAKLWVVPVAVYGVSKGQSHVVHRSSVAMGYAGSTLVATSLYSFVSAALQGLSLKVGGSVPSVEEIAEFIARAARNFVREIGSRFSNPRQARTDLLVFGYCQRSKYYKIFTARSDFEGDEFNIQFGELKGSAGCINLIGDPVAIEAFQKMTIDPQGRGAFELLSELISSGAHPSIGGSVQVIRADKSGARIVPTLHREQGGAYLKLLNTRIENEYGTVGQCTFGSEAFGLF